MKKIILLIALILITTVNAQAPQGFNYQATVRNSTGALIVNQNVNFKFNIMLNSQTSVPIFSETHYVPTDDLGQVNLVIGTGTATTGAFSSINWGNGTYYLGIELNTGSGYVAMGTTQLLSVPYALHANTATSTTGNTVGFTHYVGELFGGGIVVSVWKTAGVEHGLIASLSDLSAGIQWTTPEYQNVSVSGIGALDSPDGLVNSNAIIAQAGLGTNYAAGLCRSYNAGGYSDWYLPSGWELNLCYNNALILNEILGNANGFKYLAYMSSNEMPENPSEFFLVNFRTSNPLYYSSKASDIFPVRAVRRF